MLENTDKAVGQLIEAIQQVTPEAAAQAVAYSRFVDIVWLATLGPITLVIFVVTVIFTRRANRNGWTDEADIPTSVGICAGCGWIVAFLLAIGCLGFAIDVNKTIIAPDYYAAQLTVELAQEAFGK